MNSYHRVLSLILLLPTLFLFAGCDTATAPPAVASAGGANSEDSTVLLSVTSDAAQNPQSVDMAMKLAGFSLDEGRRVAMFFNVKGVKFPTNDFPDDSTFQENSPLKTQLRELIERGADIHVCPICMKALSVEEADLIEGAKVTTRPSLFAHIGPDTAVFTY